MTGATLRATLHTLGITVSTSRPSVSNDNAFSESLFATLKHIPSYPNKPFASLGQARSWGHQFVRWYNHEHRHHAIRYMTPNDRHEDKDRENLTARNEFYQKEKAKNPARWPNGTTKNCDPITDAVLNPTR